MADSEKEERSPRSRRNTSGAASRRSGASRPSSPAPLTRYVSGNFIDDQAQYHGHRYHGESEKENEEAVDLEDGSVQTEDSEDTEEVSEGSSESIVPEVRDGIEDQRDVEVGPKLEKLKSEKSRRSIRDPNLVTWDGPDDKANPKNWSPSRKWAATLVGGYPIRSGGTSIEELKTDGWQFRLSRSFPRFPRPWSLPL
jgi:hypothetical protein